MRMVQISHTTVVETTAADKISDLPNTLLTQILSLLPTKQSVATSILSKRWRFLWSTVPILNFNDQFQEPQFHNNISTGFTDFVYSVLLFHQVQPLNRFILRCANCSNSSITAWVRKAAQRKVKEIDITLSTSRYVVLPRRLFNCETVSVMKLNGVYLNVLMSFSVRLPKLRVLHVGDNVLFGCHDYIFTLLAGCPVLEDLVLESSYSEACGGLACAKAEFELDFKRLAKVKIGFSWRKICQISIFRIFKALCNVRFLSITHSTTACLQYASARDIRVFNNLIQLEISFGNYYWDLLAKLLQNSPKLEALIIHKEPHESTKGQESKWNPPHVPDCLSVHLKTFCLKECRGWDSEMELVGYIMQNARVLETITIYISSSLASEAQLQIRRDFSIIQRRYQSCQIVFH